jgi:nitrile hydratase accessory protein
VTDSRTKRVLDTGGPAAPPRKNGELVFSEPWESRVFGLTMALQERGAFEWEEFRQRLIAEISAWEREHGERDEYRYYARWQCALELLLADKGLCLAGSIDSLAEKLAARPPGHDH